MEGKEQFILQDAIELRIKRQEAISGLQRALILMSHHDTLQWITLNGESFRRFVERRPEYLDRFNEEDPEAIAKEVQDLMFVEED